MSTNSFPVILEKAFMISPSVKHFVFQSKLDPVFDYLPGQFITIHFEHGGKILRRSYSIANTPQNNNTIEFAASYVKGGPGTELLFNLKPGDTIQLTGPFGRLTLKEDNPERYVFIATSTGVTPYRAMIAELQRRLDKHPNLHVVVLQGVQRREDVLYGQEFLSWANDNPRVTFRAHLSRDQREDWQPHEYEGHVQRSFTELNLNPTKDWIYLCGNPAMIDESFELLKELGFTTQQIIREKYISSK